MFEKFTDKARRVVVLAQEEAKMLNHNYIGTEHLLLGLIHEGEGVAAKANRFKKSLARDKPHQPVTFHLRLAPRRCSNFRFVRHFSLATVTLAPNTYCSV
jgi:ATP-dependent Clp protease ATP-binding subunit ClpA